MLVVIGIIAILIAILLPSIIAARRQANLVRCQTNLREITTGCLLHAHDHRGYMPLAGELVIEDAPWTALTLMNGLNDRERKRYTYASATGTSITHVITPLPAAIAPYMSTRGLRYDNWDTLDQQLNDTRGVWKMFMCPQTNSAANWRLHPTSTDTTPTGQGSMMIVSVGGSITHYWSSNSDFAFNETVFGFDYRSQYVGRRLAGNVTKISHPSELMLFCDARLAAQVDPRFGGWFNFPWITIAPTLDATPQPITLGDVLAESSKITPYHARLDPQRHRGQVNVAFADGHVEAVQIGPGALSRVILAAR